MAQKSKTLARQPHSPIVLKIPAETSDLVERDGPSLGFDLCYGESLRPLLPKRLHDLVPRA
jgi:hypothetical protein